MIIKANSIYIPLKDKSVQMACSSPPYWGLRRYSIPDTIWPGKIEKWGSGYTCHHKFDKDNFCYGGCGTWKGQLGCEPSIQLFIEHLMLVMNEIWRVLKDDGICFINLGDTYAGSGGAGGHYNKSGKRAEQPRYQQTKPNVKRKSMCLIPERFVIACQHAGWIVRNEIIWHKPNGLPSSVRDRFPVDFEKIFFLTKNTDYFFNSLYEPHGHDQRLAGVQRAREYGYKGKGTYQDWYNKERKKQSWHDHSNDEKMGFGQQIRGNKIPRLIHPKGRVKRCVWSIPTQPYSENHFATFPELLVKPLILCSTKPGDFVLDPFAGSGTVSLIAEKIGRKAIGLDLGYQDLQKKRLGRRRRRV